MKKIVILTLFTLSFCTHAMESNSFSDSYDDYSDSELISEAEEALVDRYATVFLDEITTPNEQLLIEQFLRRKFKPNTKFEQKLMRHLILKAGNKGHIPSMVKLGQMYRDGYCVKKDDELATNIFNHLSSTHSVQAMMSYAALIAQGRTGHLPGDRLSAIKKTLEVIHAELYIRSVIQNKLDIQVIDPGIFIETDALNHPEETTE